MNNKQTCGLCRGEMTVVKIPHEGKANKRVKVKCVNCEIEYAVWIGVNEW